MFKHVFTVAAAAGLFLAGCGPTTPELTSLEVQAIQSREFETDKSVAFAATLSVFQDLGYIVASADFDTGFISAKSPTQTNTTFWRYEMKDTKATAFVEQMRPDVARIRLNFVDSNETSGSYGIKTADEQPILDPQIYENAFTRIREGIFIRTAQTE